MIDLLVNGHCMVLKLLLVPVIDLLCQSREIEQRDLCLIAKYLGTFLEDI